MRSGPRTSRFGIKSRAATSNCREASSLRRRFIGSESAQRQQLQNCIAECSCRTDKSDDGIRFIPEDYRFRVSDRLCCLQSASKRLVTGCVSSASRITQLSTRRFEVLRTHCLCVCPFVFRQCLTGTRRRHSFPLSFRGGPTHFLFRTQTDGTDALFPLQLCPICLHGRVDRRWVDPSLSRTNASECLQANCFSFHLTLKFLRQQHFCQSPEIVLIESPLELQFVTCGPLFLRQRGLLRHIT